MTFHIIFAFQIKVKEMSPCLTPGFERRLGWMKARRSFCFPAVNEAGGSCWTLGGQLGVTGWGETPAQVLEDVQRQAADQRDDGNLP